jgi:hypothetical protein
MISKNKLEGIVSWEEKSNETFFGYGKNDQTRLLQCRILIANHFHSMLNISNLLLSKFIICCPGFLYAG